MCAEPRSGSFPDVQGAVTDENFWLRSYSNDTYLWQQVAEYTCEIRTERGMSELEIRVEARPGESAEACEELVGAIENDFRQTYHLRVPVHLAEPATLPRFELKARRWIRT
jgi:phenylacetate-CoA ligase